MSRERLSVNSRLRRPTERLIPIASNQLSQLFCFPEYSSGVKTPFNALGGFINDEQQRSLLQISNHLEVSDEEFELSQKNGFTSLRKIVRELYESKKIDHTVADNAFKALKKLAKVAHLYIITRDDITQRERLEKIPIIGKELTANPGSPLLKSLNDALNKDDIVFFLALTKPHYNYLQAIEESYPDLLPQDKITAAFTNPTEKVIKARHEFLTVYLLSKNKFSPEIEDINKILDQELDDAFEQKYAQQIIRSSKSAEEMTGIYWATGLATALVGLGALAQEFKLADPTTIQIFEKIAAPIISDWVTYYIQLAPFLRGNQVRKFFVETPKKMFGEYLPSFLPNLIMAASFGPLSQLVYEQGNHQLASLILASETAIGTSLSLVNALARLKISLGTMLKNNPALFPVIFSSYFTSMLAFILYGQGSQFNNPLAVSLISGGPAEHGVTAVAAYMNVDHQKNHAS
jgi:hypothetical protein